MDDKFKDFKEAATDIDELSLSGFFGESVKKLVESRDATPLDDQFIQILEN